MIFFIVNIRETCYIVIVYTIGRFADKIEKTVQHQGTGTKRNANPCYITRGKHQMY